MASNSSWGFATIGVTNPTILSLTPADNSLNASIDLYPQIVFTEYVFKGTGSITLVNRTNGQTTVWTASSSAVQLNGNVVTLVTELRDFASYYIIVDKNAFVSVAGLPTSGVTADQWNFITAGAMTLFIAVKDSLQQVSINGASYQSALKSIGSVSTAVRIPLLPVNVLAVAIGSLNFGTGGLVARLVNAKTGNTIAATSSVTSNMVFTTSNPGEGNDTSWLEVDYNTTDEWNETVPLQSCISDPYIASAVGDGAQWTWPGGCQDFSVVTATTTYIRWLVPTDEYPKLSATLYPANKATSVSTGLSAITISFSVGGDPEFVQKGWGNISVQDESSGLFYTIDVNSSAVSVSGSVASVTMPQLGAGKLYHVAVSSTAFVSFSGVYWAGIAAPVCVDGSSCTPALWAFSTAGASSFSPVLQPASGNITVPIGLQFLKLTFNQLPNIGSGFIVMFNYQHATSVSINVSASAGAVTVSGFTATIKIPATVTGANYSIQVPSTAFITKVNSPSPLKFIVHRHFNLTVVFLEHNGHFWS